ncbi:MAG: ATP-binding protein, partial [Fibrobacterota bacterium]
KQAEAASRAKDEFLSHMSHELRTPLNAIQGFADLTVQSSSLSSENLDNLRSIQQSAAHLTHLVNDILDLARLENGSLALACGGFSPEACIDEVLDLIRPAAKEKNLPVNWNRQAELPRVMGDRVRWKQILLNVVANAVKYTKDGSVEVTCEWNPTGQDHGILSCRVRDTGIGIAPQDQERIFDRFQRLGGFDAPSGTGLGLAISSNLARAMGGTISIESCVGNGSTFTLTLPFRTAPPDPASLTSLALRVPSDLRGFRILLAEDNRVNIKLATQVLSRLHAQFDVAEDGIKALDLLCSNQYDLLLLDLHMPGKDGFEVAQAIRDPNSNVPNKRIPILALTADAFEETRQRALQAGMDDFLSKPFRIIDLCDKALRLVHGKGADA